MRVYSDTKALVDLRKYYTLHSVQMVRTLLRKWWKLELAFADADGYVLDHMDGKVVASGNRFCLEALHCKEGFRRCNESLKEISEKVKKSNGNSVHDSCHLGFHIAASPILFDDTLVGFCFVGGALEKPLGLEDKNVLFSRMQEFSGMSEDDMELSLTGSPCLKPEEVKQLNSMLEYATEQIMQVYRAKNAELSQGVIKEGASPMEPVTVSKQFGGIVGSAPAMQSLFSLLEKVVKCEATVLVHGESGTGKELIARAIHFCGPRAKKPFVVQNCSAFNDNLLESALFGHVRGAFTGAVREQKGLFETANGGTFFLDEIGDMSPALQVKLLRVLQEGILTPVGATKPIKVDVRIVAASHRDLGAMVKQGTFREDLYYRVNVLRVTVPPLRERVEDIPMLAQFFLEMKRREGGPVLRLGEDTIAAFKLYSWPGNIRELQNEIERLQVLSVDDEYIKAHLLSPRIAASIEKQIAVNIANKATGAASLLAGSKQATLKELVEGVESKVIQQGLIRTHWNKSQLAKELGISRSILIQKCSFYGFERKN